MIPPWLPTSGISARPDFQLAWQQTQEQEVADDALLYTSLRSEGSKHCRNGEWTFPQS